MGQYVLEVVLVIAAATAVLCVPRARPARRQHAPGVWRHPGTWLGVTVALFFVNQILVTAFVDQVWHGNPGPVTRYLPSGWFNLADLGSIAWALPAWSWTVLHVQAALELPFVMLAYLLVCRWCGQQVFARVLAVRWLMSASFTITFCLIELDFASPYTATDLVIRVASGIVTPLLLPTLAAGTGKPPGLVSLAFSVGALGYLVLAVYDVATLYNLGHAADWAPGAAVAGAVLALSRWLAVRGNMLRGLVVASATRSIGWFLVLFAVPSLSLRYGITFGARPIALVTGAVLVMLSLWWGWDHRHIRELGVAASVAVLAATAGYFITPGYTEARLLAAAVAFVLTGGLTCVLLDRSRETADNGAAS
ncbi:hypothetical protein [Curtobacterium sp. L1-20]|uniref:hypothetical protein n=1 Tax=Curtobacterium sp. L1-20 TaxID=3138181 RepID=UPI003B52D1EA